MEKKELEKRVDQLEDDRFEKMIYQINDLHKILLGNGKEGIIQLVAKNTTRIKILMWVIGIIVSGAVGSYFGFSQITTPSLDGMPTITLEKPDNVSTNK